MAAPELDFDQLESVEDLPLATEDPESLFDADVDDLSREPEEPA